MTTTMTERIGIIEREWVWSVCSGACECFSWYFHVSVKLKIWRQAAQKKNCISLICESNTPAKSEQWKVHSKALKDFQCSFFEHYDRTREKLLSRQFVICLTERKREKDIFSLCVSNLGCSCCEKLRTLLCTFVTSDLTISKRAICNNKRIIRRRKHKKIVESNGRRHQTRMVFFELLQSNWTIAIISSSILALHYSYTPAHNSSEPKIPNSSGQATAGKSKRKSSFPWS